MVDPATATHKSRLRMEARNRRRALLVEHPEADWLAADRAGEMLAALGIAREGTMALYKALGAELDPRPLGEAMLKRGWRLAMPRVVDLEGPMVFRRWRPGQRLAHDLSGMPAPLDSAGEMDPDLVLVPLLAFDRGGGRLGQGGGHYDRTLAALRGRGLAPPCIGFAYSGQEVARLPREAHDQPLDGILTEAGYIQVRKDF
jgi:5-formyltetrahydrofolate cyclo-ligase